MIKVPMTLRYNDTGTRVEEGDRVISHRGEEAVVADGVGATPHKTSSTGRIYVEEGNGTRSYFPSVFGCRWHYDDPKAAHAMGLYIPTDNLPPLLQDA